MNAEQRKKLRDQVWGPYISAAVKVFSSEDGKKVLEALEREFSRSLIAYDPNGRVDEYATLINAARADVVAFLRELATPKEDRT